LGIAVDPSFTNNHFVWVYFTKQTNALDCGGTIKNRVVRFRLEDNNTVITDPDTAGCFPVDPFVTIHNGGNLHFGPDGILYVTVGNNDEVNQGDDPAQNLSSPLGKIHRFIPGIPLTVPGDNPFPDSSIYARGLRNSFDFDFDPVNGVLFATENGEACDDEINRILPGYDYGWRPFYPPPPCDDYDGADPAFNTVQPLFFWTTSVAPTGLTFYTSDLIPEWKNDLFMCSYKDATTAIHHFKFNASRTAIVSHTILSDTINHQPITCRTDLLTGPEGALYYSQGGGYPQNNGPIKRLVRRTSFQTSSVSVSPGAARAGGEVDFVLNVRHVGVISNTFALTAQSPADTFVVSGQAAHGNLQFSNNTVWWAGTIEPNTAWTATYRLQLAAPTDPYLLTSLIQLTAPGALPITFAPVVIVNGRSVFLPIVRRN
jgi:glucose/arabinose dehydrogenase